MALCALGNVFDVTEFSVGTELTYRDRDRRLIRARSNEVRSRSAVEWVVRGYTPWRARRVCENNQRSLEQHTLCLHVTHMRRLCLDIPRLVLLRASWEVDKSISFKCCSFFKLMRGGCVKTKTTSYYGFDFLLSRFLKLYICSLNFVARFLVLLNSIFYSLFS